MTLHNDLGPAQLEGDVDDRGELRDCAFARESDENRTEPMTDLHVSLGHFLLYSAARRIADIQARK